MFFAAIITLLYPFNPLPSHEGRHNPSSRNFGFRNFQSTSLSRGKTLLQLHSCTSGKLSIHFPLTREDVKVDRRKGAVISFNPLPSHEGRQQKALIFFSKVAHFSDITNNNISSNKIAPYLQHFLRYKKLIFSGANLPGNLCSLMVRTIFPYKISYSLFKTITVPSHQIRVLLQYALPYFYIGLPDNKNAGCPFLCQ